MSTTKLPSLRSSVSIATRSSLLMHEKRGDYDDDIECLPWLEELGLEQYEETFLKNFSSTGFSSLLSRRRLAQVRLKNFPHIGVEQYAHQKLLLEHIRLVLLHSFHSPERRQAASLTRASLVQSMPTIAPTPKQPPLMRRPLRILPVPPKRRRSFDRHAWQSISQLRTPSSFNRHNGTTRRRSLSMHFEPAHGPLSAAEKGLKYGIMSQVLDGIRAEMMDLRDGLLSEIAAELNCEAVDLYFVDSVRRELLLFSRGSWFSRPIHSSVAGLCVSSAKTELCNDARRSDRHDCSIDDHLFEHRVTSVLCVPLVTTAGGGDVLAVLHCRNKKESKHGFGAADVAAAEAAAATVTVELDGRLAVLALAPAALSGAAVYVGSIAGSRRGHHFDDPTAASTAYGNTVRGHEHARDEGPFHFNAPSADDVEKERVKLRRRQNYAETR